MAATRKKTINLALQGGGSHGALTWGVLDRLLEDERLTIAEISGTSAGAMNAVVLADGFARGGAPAAREALELFWRAVSAAALFSPMQRGPLDRMMGRHSLDQSPGFLMAEGLSRMFSPAQINPLGIDPLRNLLELQVDFDRVNRCEDITVHVTATHVATGQARIFSRGALTPDAVLASACLPQVSPTVMIDGEAYWDGGFSANPALTPLVVSKASPDIVIVQINPTVRRQIPQTARDIINRINEISFNTSLIKELRAIALMQQVIAARGLDLGALGQTHLHLIHADAEVQDLQSSSRMNAEWAFLRTLFERGRGWAARWLDESFDKIGYESSFDLSALFDDPPEVAP